MASSDPKPKPVPRFPVKKPASGNIAPANSGSSQQREAVGKSSSSQTRDPIPPGRPNSSQLREPVGPRAGSSQMRNPVPGQGIITMRQMPGAPPSADDEEGPVVVTPAAAKPSSAPVKPQPGKPALPQRPAGTRSIEAARPPRTVEAPKAKKVPESMSELVRLLARIAIKHNTGLTVQEFDEKYVPRMAEMLPEALRVSAHTVLLEHFLEFAHVLYIAIVTGRFKERPVLCAVRAAELAADLTERAQAHYAGDGESRIESIRCRNLIVGVTLQAVRLIESANLDHENVKGLTDSFERAVITVYGLKTQAEATGGAPWTGVRENQLDKRIGAAINAVSNAFGEYISKRAPELSAEDNHALLAEFDGFMERFAPYIEGGRATAMERARQMSKNLTGVYGRPEKIEPLTVVEIKSRPAGVEIHLEDKRVLFISTDDAKNIGLAAEGEAVDSRRMRKSALDSRKKTNPDADDEAALMEELQAHVDAAKRDRAAQKPSGNVKPPTPPKR
ncbi:MAG: hypothetical protein IT462_15820 [Planctomycetes bacterium]|nr:hypothetical protein [Planctomycetota bacterium]